MQQQTGVPPIIMQQVHPPFMHAIRHSQQPWIMSQQALSPLVQVTQQPSLVISTLQAPIVILQVQTTMPFIMQHMLHMPPVIMVQRFCIMVQAVGSSQTQVIFMPPAHFSTFMVQRGTMTMFGAMGTPGADIGIPELIPDMAARSIIIAVVIIPLPRSGEFHFNLGLLIPQAAKTTSLKGEMVEKPEKSTGVIAFEEKRVKITPVRS
jgi:hypothetical protein